MAVASAVIDVVTDSMGRRKPGADEKFVSVSAQIGASRLERVGRLRQIRFESQRYAELRNRHCGSPRPLRELRARSRAWLEQETSLFKRAGLFAFVVLIFCCTVATAQQDPFVGTWKQNLAKSKYDPVSLAPKTGTTLHREAAGNNAYKNTTNGVDAQGAPTHTEDTVTLDGNDYPVKGANWDTVSAKKLDANTVITVDKKGGTVVRMGRTIVSKDGKTCTSEYLGYTAKGVAFHNVIVWEKQ